MDCGFVCLPFSVMETELMTSLNSFVQFTYMHLKEPMHLEGPSDRTDPSGMLISKYLAMIKASLAVISSRPSNLLLKSAEVLDAICGRLFSGSPSPHIKF